MSLTTSSTNTKICQIAKLNQLTIDFIGKRINIQLAELKTQIETSIVFFSSSYIYCSDDEELNDDVLEKKYMDGYKTMIESGYENMAKINMMLEILETSDRSQTNKIKYDLVSKIIFSSGHFLNIFNELSIISMTKKIEKCLDKGEINKNWDDYYKVLQIDNLHKEREKFALNEKINIFNHYINQIILQLCKIKLELKDTWTE
jgi:hypothetical protein